MVYNMEDQEVTNTTSVEITTTQVASEMENIQETSVNEVAASIDNLTAKITDLQGEFHFAFLIIFCLAFFIMLGKVLKNMIDI